MGFALAATASGGQFCAQGPLQARRGVFIKGVKRHSLGVGKNRSEGGLLNLDPGWHLVCSVTAHGHGQNEYNGYSQRCCDSHVGVLQKFKCTALTKYFTLFS
jgi:hypothetical protein